MTFVDVAAGMLGEDGQPRPEIFKEDGLHMNRAGYVIWRDALRPLLMKGEAAFERP
jgi:lysophospholipase L1-like esterase